MKKIFLILPFIIILIFNNCCTKKRIDKPDPVFKETVILVSMDGFRYDYMSKANTPALDRIVSSGVKAAGLIPAFPSKTFPNHLSIITGLYPEHHGIISNRFYDAESDEWYKLGTNSVTQSKWYQGEPIWVTAEKQNIITATYFWPGSEAKIKGYRPTYWKAYNHNTPFGYRVNQIFEWLEKPDEERPQFLTLYFHEPDESGHKYGPESAETIQAIENVDKYIGKLLDGIKSRNLEDIINVIVVSDHGMSSISRDSVIFFDDYINTDDITIIDYSPVSQIRPDEGKLEEVYNALKNAHPKMKVYKKEDVPEHLHYSDHPFIQPIIAIADEHWSITTHDYFNSHNYYATGGTHGFYPSYQSMHAVFLATGPAFKVGETVDELENIHIYNLICELLKITPEEVDGNLESIKHVLKE